MPPDADAHAPDVHAELRPPRSRGLEHPHMGGTADGDTGGWEDKGGQPAACFHMGYPNAWPSDARAGNGARRNPPVAGTLNANPRDRHGLHHWNNKDSFLRHRVINNARSARQELCRHLIKVLD
eukprot:gene23771-11672_t